MKKLKNLKQFASRRFLKAFGLGVINLISILIFSTALHEVAHRIWLILFLASSLILWINFKPFLKAVAHSVKTVKSRMYGLGTFFIPYIVHMLSDVFFVHRPVEQLVYTFVISLAIWIGWIIYKVGAHNIIQDHEIYFVAVVTVAETVSISEDEAKRQIEIALLEKSKESYRRIQMLMIICILLSTMAALYFLNLTFLFGSLIVFFVIVFIYVSIKYHKAEKELKLKKQKIVH